MARAVTGIPSEPPQPISLLGLPADEFPAWLEGMALIREFERVTSRLARAGKIPGGMHSAAGQEAVAVGAMAALRSEDIITCSHRSHHHSLARGMSPRSIMAELYGKADGCLGGRGGHMHLADFSLGLYGSNGIVGGGLGLAMGIALATKMRHISRVALGCFGDGGANTGRVWEFINLASVWQLPLIALCENNRYAVETSVERVMAADSIARRASGFGLPAHQVDGQDVGAVYRAVAEARTRGIDGGGPTFLEVLTYRYEGHNTDDDQRYRTREEVEYWRTERDPLTLFKNALSDVHLLDEVALRDVSSRVQDRVRDAVAYADSAPWPDPATASRNVTSL